MLYLEHSVESLARGGPWQLGKILQGSSGWRALSEAETAVYGGSSLRRLYGCAITMVKPDSHAAHGSSPGDGVRPTAEGCLGGQDAQAPAGGHPGERCTADGSMGEMFEQQLFTWSQVCASGPAVNILLPLEEILALAFLFARK